MIIYRTYHLIFLASISLSVCFILTFFHSSFSVPVAEAITCGAGVDNGSGQCVIILKVASSSPWTVPSDWNDASNTIQVIGPGANGAASGGINAGVGGGGGAYASTSNLTLIGSGSTTVAFSVGAVGSTTASSTWFSSQGLVKARGGSGQTGGSVAAGSGFSGGNGGNGGGIPVTGGGGGGGGGGAAGPSGVGRTGANGNTTVLQLGGGGGGGNGGGADGSSGASGHNGGNGGDGSIGSGGGAGGAGIGGNATAASGGGGAGGAGTTVAGGAFVGGGGATSTNIVPTILGAGGGGGGGGGNTRTAGTGNNAGGGGPAGAFGAGGGGGGGCTDSGCTPGSGGAGGDGLIVIMYAPEPPAAIVTQTHYHWRNDNGSETTATSLTGGTEDTAATNISRATPVRLRIQISNEGATSTPSQGYTLEYGTKVTTCAAVTGWTDVGAGGGDWDMYNSTNITEGNNTTNIAVSAGGVTDENSSFLTPNSAVKDTSSTIASTTLSSSQFMEAEFSIKQTTESELSATYCFRLTSVGNDLDDYTRYPELTTESLRDFEVQRGTFTIGSGQTSYTLTAGVNYVAPSASTSAFMRITNLHHTGAGNTSSPFADQSTVYISNPSNITSSVTFTRGSSGNSTQVSWEIVEYIGEENYDNEMVVRGQGTVTFGGSDYTATGTALWDWPETIGDSDVVVFITGFMHPLTDTAYFLGQATAEWLPSTNQPAFKRSYAAGAPTVSYAVIEFTGRNWAVQRKEHVYTAVGTTETEAITAVGSLARTFLHTQHRVAGGNAYDLGHEVWLSSIGQVSYRISSTTSVTAPFAHTSVAWIIENTQTGTGAMDVARSNGTTVGGTAPLTVSVPIGKTLSDITNASIFATGHIHGFNYTGVLAGIAIASTTHYEVWRANTTDTLTYRTEVVEWPTVDLALIQNYYRFYVDNNALDPTDPWPAGAADLGENTEINAFDEPLGVGERLRIRMSVKAERANLPADAKAFKLQYAALYVYGSCTAIPESNWSTLGDTSSSTLWRGYNATGTTDGTLLSGDPPTGGDLNLSVSDVAGTLEEINNTASNTNAIYRNNDMEYDWIVEQNGADYYSFYCFRMVHTNGDLLTEYRYSPRVLTSHPTYKTQDWQWYANESEETPTTTLAGVNVAPADIVNEDPLKLRITVLETENAIGENAHFKLQYSEYADFSIAEDVVATTTCTANSIWCYANGGGINNAVISSSTLSDAEPCSGGVGRGCGTHNESPASLNGFTHGVGAAAEYEFTIKPAGPRVNRTYYFRLYDQRRSTTTVPNTGESYPSLSTEGAQLTFTMSGLASSTIIEGVTLDIDTTPTTISFGELTPGSLIEGAHRLGIDTNGTEGYQLFMMMQGDLTNPSGATVKQVTGTNASPTAWNDGCSAGAASCLGYHTGDDTLQGGSTRFSALDTYAGLSTTTLDEVSYSSQPSVGETTDIVFRILVRELQDAGLYETNIMYVSVPIF